jgi:hypothetical protein
MPGLPTRPERRTSTFIGAAEAQRILTEEGYPRLGIGIVKASSLSQGKRLAH